jgi:hypothetical protein
MADDIIVEVRMLAMSLDAVGKDPTATLDDIEAIRARLKTMLGLDRSSTLVRAHLQTDIAGLEQRFHRRE